MAKDKESQSNRLTLEWRGACSECKSRTHRVNICVTVVLNKDKGDTWPLQC